MNPFYRTGAFTTYHHYAINPKKPITIWHYIGKMNDEAGKTQALYTMIESYATIQIPTVQELEQAQLINIAKVKRKFWFDSEEVSTLNRNLNKGEDYIEWHGLYYNVFLIDSQRLGDDIVVWGSEQKEPPGINAGYGQLNPVIDRDILNDE